MILTLAAKQSVRERRLIDEKEDSEIAGDLFSFQLNHHLARWGTPVVLIPPLQAWIHLSVVS